MSEDTSLEGLAQVLAWFYPDVWPKLKAAHVADPSGHCPACRSHALGTPVWPCRLWLAADGAEQITAVVVRERAERLRRVRSLDAARRR
jgi:hypothetical protein